jgi:hypothetical protein
MHDREARQVREDGAGSIVQFDGDVCEETKLDRDSIVDVDDDDSSHHWCRCVDGLRGENSIQKEERKK